jgi:hypothetical protein
MGEDSARIHETDFCAKVASWVSAFLVDSDSPFANAAIEGYGSGTMRQKRKDLRLFDHNGNTVLTGEVRLPRGKR